MKRFLLLFLISTLSFCSVKAQDANADNLEELHKSFSLGVEISDPTSLFGDVYSLGIGPSVQVNFPIANKFSITYYAAYINYILKKTYGSGSEGRVPVLNGMEFNFSHRFFASVQAGYSFHIKSGGAFTYSPGIGFKLKKRFTALVKYTGYVQNALNSGAIGVRAAYTFLK